MSVLRWAAFVLAAVCLGGLWVTPVGAASMVLAVLFFLFFLILCWTFGAFSDSRKVSR